MKNRAMFEKSEQVILQVIETNSDLSSENIENRASMNYQWKEGLNREKKLPEAMMSDDSLGNQELFNAQFPSRNFGSGPCSSTDISVQSDSGRAGLIEATEELSDHAEVETLEDAEKELASIQKAIQTFMAPVNLTYEDLEQIISPVYEKITRRIDNFSYTIVLKNMVPEFHIKVTKVYEDLNRAKKKLEHLSQETIQRVRGEVTSFKQDCCDNHSYFDSGTGDHLLIRKTTLDGGCLINTYNESLLVQDIHLMPLQRGPPKVVCQPHDGGRNDKQPMATDNRLTQDDKNKTVFQSLVERKKTEQTEDINDACSDVDSGFGEEDLALRPEENEDVFSQPILNKSTPDYPTFRQTMENTAKIDIEIRATSTYGEVTQTPDIEIPPKILMNKTLLDSKCDTGILKDLETREHEIKLKQLKIKSEHSKQILRGMLGRIMSIIQICVPDCADISEVRKRHCVDIPRLHKMLELFDKHLCEYVVHEELDRLFYSTCVSAYEEAYAWIQAIETLYDQMDIYNIDIESDQIKECIKISVFDGSHKQTVYEFIEDFEAVYLGSGRSMVRAKIMYQSYLSPLIKAKSRHLASDYSLLKTWLIDYFGDVFTIGNLVISALEDCHRTKIGGNLEAICFYGEVLTALSRLDQIMVQPYLSSDEATEFIYSRSVLERLIALIPEEDVIKLSDMFRKVGVNTRKPCGKLAFETFKEFVKNMMEDLSSLSAKADYRQKNVETMKALSDITTCGTNNVASNPQRVTEKDVGERLILADQDIKTQTFSKNWWSEGVKFPCPIIGHDHELSNCKEFFQLSPAQRRSIAKRTERRLCWCCLRPTRICKKQCNYARSSRSDILKCQGCIKVASSRGLTPLNVLFCVKHEHNTMKPSSFALMSALRDYLGGIPKGLTANSVAYHGCQDDFFGKTKGQSSKVVESRSYMLPEINHTRYNSESIDLSADEVEQDVPSHFMSHSSRLPYCPSDSEQYKLNSDEAEEREYQNRIRLKDQVLDHYAYRDSESPVSY